MTIRPASIDDLPFVRQCARAAYAPYVERIGREPAPMVADFAAALERAELEVIEVEGTVAGFIVSFTRGDSYFIENVAVFPVHAGRGLGRKLIDHAEKRAREAGLDRVELYTNEKMTENLTFYPRLGYVEMGRRTEDGFNRVYFAKQLSV